MTKHITWNAFLSHTWTNSNGLTWPTSYLLNKVFSVSILPKKCFFSLIVFGGTEVPIVLIFSSAAPQRSAYSEVPFQMAAHLRTGNPLLAGEIAGFEPRTAVSQSGVTTNEPPLLPAPAPQKSEEYYMKFISLCLPPHTVHKVSLSPCSLQDKYCKVSDPPPLLHHSVKNVSPFTCCFPSSFAIPYRRFLLSTSYNIYKSSTCPVTLIISCVFIILLYFLLYKLYIYIKLYPIF